MLYNVYWASLQPHDLYGACTWLLQLLFLCLAVRNAVIVVHKKDAEHQGAFCGRGASHHCAFNAAIEFEVFQYARRLFVAPDLRSCVNYALQRTCYFSNEYFDLSP